MGLCIAPTITIRERSILSRSFQISHMDHVFTHLSLNQVFVLKLSLELRATIPSFLSTPLAMRSSLGAHYLQAVEVSLFTSLVGSMETGDGTQQLERA